MASTVCSACRYEGSDVRLKGCGCTLHTRCTPLSLVLAPNDGNDFGAFPAAVCSPTVPCPVCRTPVSGIQLLPLDLSSLEKAIEMQKSSSEASKKRSGSMSSSSLVARAGTKHARDDSDDDDDANHAESLYLVMSNSGSSSLSTSSAGGLSSMDLQRTGRWTDEEIQYVDFLINAFDHGGLPLPHGMKLNEFLGEMLLCKSSRLTKKMKNAKLSTRSFKLTASPGIDIAHSCTMLSSLQEKFLMSVQSETMRLQLRFNITKQWRIHFSNMCVQVGYGMLDGTQWVDSLEEIERRAFQAEDRIRRSRRRRMGLALRTDTGSSASRGVYIQGVKAKAAANILTNESAGAGTRSGNPNAGVAAAASVAQAMSADDSVRPDPILTSMDVSKRGVSTSGKDSNNSSHGDFLSSMMDSMSSDPFMNGNAGLVNIDAGQGKRGRPRTFSEDFNAMLSDLMDPTDPPLDNSGIEAPNMEQPKSQEKLKQRPLSSVSNTTTINPGGHYCGPFLDTVISYIEHKNLPFQYVDVFVPSFASDSTSSDSSTVSGDDDHQNLRLYQAGFGTRTDLDPLEAFPWHEFGVYSEKFSFKPGHGLVGRVYASGTPSWEKGIHNMDVTRFERAGGAKVYGVKTAFGIPLSTPMVGRICILLYSSSELELDQDMMNTIASEVSTYSPEPKWKLVIDMNDGQPEPNSDLGVPPDVKAKLTPRDEALATSRPFSVTSKQKPTVPMAVDAKPAAMPQQMEGVTCSARRSVADAIADEEEQCLISLLGDSMPVPTAGGSNSDGASPNLLPHFMQIRLLLLRPAARRSAQETDMLDILKKSYRSYSKDNRRTGLELANLLVQDWICLKQAYEPASASGAMSSPLAMPMPSVPGPFNEGPSKSGVSSFGASFDGKMPGSSTASPHMNAKVSPVHSGVHSSGAYTSHVMSATMSPARTSSVAPPFPALPSLMGHQQLQHPSMTTSNGQTGFVGQMKLCSSMTSPATTPHQPSNPSVPGGVTPEASQPRPTIGSVERRGSVATVSSSSGSAKATPLGAQPQMGHSNMILR